MKHTSNKKQKSLHGHKASKGTASTKAWAARAARHTTMLRSALEYHGDTVYIKRNATVCIMFSTGRMYRL